MRDLIGKIVTLGSFAFFGRLLRHGEFFTDILKIMGQDGQVKGPTPGEYDLRDKDVWLQR